MELRSLRTDLLRLEQQSRVMQFAYDNKYALAHLKEVNLLVQLALVQLDYAALAHEGLD